MSSLRFEFEWQEPAGARGEELRATWASLSILIDGIPVTELQDRQSKSVRTSVFLPLYPLAEWIADNWWFLHSEAEQPESAKSRAFDRRHNLQWAREGFVLPSLRFVTLGDGVEAMWQTLDNPGAGIKFLATGSARLSAKLVQERLRNFVDAVIARLDDQNLPHTTLHEQWEAIQNADAGEREFCRSAARLGADPYAIDSRLETAIFDAHQKIRTELLDDFLSVADPAQLNEQTNALAAASESIAFNEENFDALARVRSLTPFCNTNLTPWDTGYKFAEELRSKLQGGTWKSHSLDDLAAHLGIDHHKYLMPVRDDCHFFDALVGSNRAGKPKVILNKKRPASQQFAFCRAVFEHLTIVSNRFAVVSKLRTDRQQMSRAFAAEFLVPHKMLAQELCGPTIWEDEVEDLADDYGVSAYVVKHQIENHNLARVLH